MPKLRVGIVFGGRSVEHEVSISSATSILAALDPSRYEVRLLGIDPEGRWRLVNPARLQEGARGREVLLPAVPGDGTLVAVESGEPMGQLDVVLPMVHGTGGEDGALQGFLELADVPYVGAGVLASAVQMDKEVAKRLLAGAGIPVVPWLSVRSVALSREAAAVTERALEELGLPLFVKPSSLGSSVGISKVTAQDGLVPALEHAARYDEKLLIEAAIDARELEVAVLGNHEPEASVPGEILPKREFYDYESKYVDEDTELLIPAPISEALTTELRRLALESFRLLEGAGMARVDFFLERESDRILLNEVNSVPGFTEVSMYPKLWEASGLPYPALLDRLIELALERHRERSKLERTFRSG